MVAKDEGLNKLSEYINRNKENGIMYHRSDGLKGDYDKLYNMEEVIKLLKNGRPDPYEICPTYESKCFKIRLIAIDDAEDLLECYSSTEAQRFFNNDNCWGGDNFFVNFTLDKMRNLIAGWLDKDYKTRFFVRFSIIDKKLNKAIGTIESFPNGEKIILRIDIMPQYEQHEAIGEILSITDNFFYDFKCNIMVTKAIPEALERIKALLESGYTLYPKSNTWNREYYYIKSSMREAE